MLIGASKTVDCKEYFCEGTNVRRFWGTLSFIHDIFDDDHAQTNKLNEEGVLITDISNAKAGGEKKDKEIKAQSLKDGLLNLKQTILNEHCLRRIALIGKFATKMFFTYFIDNIMLNSSKYRSYKQSLFSNYGKQEWQLKFKNRVLDCYMLTNTQRQWEKEVWKEFWQVVF